MIAGAVIMPIIFKKEIVSYEKTKQKLYDEIKQVHNRVENLKGGDNNE